MIPFGWYELVFLCLQYPNTTLGQFVSSQLSEMPEQFKQVFYGRVAGLKYREIIRRDHRDIGDLSVEAVRTIFNRVMRILHSRMSQLYGMVRVREVARLSSTWFVLDSLEEVGTEDTELPSSTEPRFLYILPQKERMRLRKNFNDYARRMV